MAELGRAQPRRPRADSSPRRASAAGLTRPPSLTAGGTASDSHHPGGFSFHSFAPSLTEVQPVLECPSPVTQRINELISWWREIRDFYITKTRLSEYDYDEPYVVRVYGLVDDQWEEMQITGENAPAVCRIVSAVRGGVISTESPPTGHMSFTKKAGYSEIDVTYFLKDHKDEELTFLLIRELRWPGENTNLASAKITSREGDKEQPPRLQIQHN